MDSVSINSELPITKPNLGPIQVNLSASASFFLVINPHKKRIDALEVNVSRTILEELCQLCHALPLSKPDTYCFNIVTIGLRATIHKVNN